MSLRKTDDQDPGKNGDAEVSGTASGAAGQGRDDASNDRDDQISFRLRRALAREISRAAEDREMAVRAFVLLGCRALGINVLDSDLVDRRGGGARGPRQCGGPAKAPGQEQLGMPVPGPEGELRQILALAKALLARGNGMQAGASIVINVGSPEPSSKARPSVHKNRPKRRK